LAIIDKACIQPLVILDFVTDDKGGGVETQATDGEIDAPAFVGSTSGVEDPLTIAGERFKITDVVLTRYDPMTLISLYGTKSESREHQQNK
jgi:hypothetical protein